MLFEKPDGSWNLAMDYCKHHQVVALIIAALPDVLTLLEQIISASGRGHTALDLHSAFSSNRKEVEKQLAVTI